MSSLAEGIVRQAGVAGYRAWVASLPDEVMAGVATSWALWSRPEQRAPEGDWTTWLIMAGRGFGKTRAGAEWVNHVATTAAAPVRIALVGATSEEVRHVMIEGESGILATALPGEAPLWTPTNNVLEWSGGSQGFVYSAATPDKLRGPQHHFVWCDEIGKWPKGDMVWDNIAFGLRLGDAPRLVATTTPRPVSLIKRLLRDSAVRVTRGRTDDNVHLPSAFLTAVTNRYAGTRLGRQELDGELIDDVEGALWTREMLEACRVRPENAGLPELVRVVIGVDPPAGTITGTGGDACGIVVCGLGRDGTGYVIEDASVAGRSPQGWALAVAQAAARHGADIVVAEANNGGRMVETVLRAADSGLPVRLVHASCGKAARAEPVALLYEGGKVRHAGAFPELEDELCGLLAGGGYEGPGRSPDRADACVWGLSELMLGRRNQAPHVRLL